MKTAIIVPARYASSRYPGKPLAELRLPDGSRKSLIRMSWEAACRVPGVDGVFVATDDDRIKDAAEGFGADVIMTDSACENGTARCADALARAGIAPEIVVNLQGDAPLTPPDFVSALIEVLRADPEVQVATPILKCDRAKYDGLIADRKNGLVGATTAVPDHHGDALYFSKEVIPWLPADVAASDDIPVFHHVGVYAYRPAALAAYQGWRVSQLEVLEGLEQLRFLANGMKVRCVEVAGQGRQFWELNNPGDVARIEAALEAG
ncbi:3-deoxy-manno-octulosonate cytidylyltransferase [Maritimibacter fusiformis]|uniref:3-deoxy-manno-octulosonate cytidylyltransferase n=1 Tax=Maritimibacter fusiformis TaxID=2603819 RepID=A0A5D0RMN5_9RHOB|nr:manno-octulosonate cytidylyltransferase [Maritimibacter fusiformis]TYB81941.1 3-deoxy-manno-octulosonate cytidylyltransferase [Maritimibacter fusiformis]